ncbi:MAG: hypothetical protein ACTSWR_03815 [Candidatus Helarchaeota archaeon]
MNKEFFMKIGIIGFIGSIILYVITFFIPYLSDLEIIIYDILILIFGLSVSISLYLLSEKFGRNGIKIASICIIDTIIISVISELTYNINKPPFYSLEYYNALSFIYGLGVVNFFLYIITSMSFGFSVLSIGRDYSSKFLQISAILWFIEMIVSFFISFFSYLIIFRWVVYGITSFCILIMIKINPLSKEKSSDKIKIKIGFEKNK